ncbi:MAG: tetratricopeptide repeat protein [Betaproteobacteria bacterium]|nr:tetratricopeptide repeat protein [Betaproteobacteria bacterium]
MTTPLIGNLEKLLAAGKDGALLRFGLGTAHLEAGDPAAAAAHLQQAVTMNPNYSAAWKLLGKALSAAGNPDGAMAAYRSGVAAAQQMGDKQTLREMEVFIRRLEKASGRP